MYNKYRSYQKIITIIILFFPAQKIYIDTFITPQIKPLYTLHPLPNFSELHPLPHKKTPKTHKKLPFFHTFSHFSINIIPYNTIQPPQIHPNNPTNNSIISTLYPYTVHPSTPYHTPINPNNNNYIFFSSFLFSFFPAPPLKPFYIPCMLLYIPFISLYNLIHLYNPYYIPLYPFKSL